MTPGLDTIATALMARGKGILSADETPGTLTRRFKSVGIESTPESRRAYREMLFTAPSMGNHISGVILQDETIRQMSSEGAPFARVLAERGVIPGIKVDQGAKPLAGRPDETITEGLDWLRERLSEYRRLGARFAKWRAVIRVSETLPSHFCIEANAHALARFAALAQEQRLVPIVAPEVLMDGAHTIDRCDEVTGRVLEAVFSALCEANVALEAMLLKPNMVVAGLDCPLQPGVEEVASATLRRLRRHVPPAVPGIVLLSGGQDACLATAHLDAIKRAPGPKPWPISFSYGRALQDPAMEAWAGRRENLAAGAAAFSQRARCNSAASMGHYTEEMELTPRRRATMASQLELQGY
jgi:fructose-bisphosphate aldolase class I